MTLIISIVVIMATTFAIGSVVVLLLVEDDACNDGDDDGGDLELVFPHGNTVHYAIAHVQGEPTVGVEPTIMSQYKWAAMPIRRRRRICVSLSLPNRTESSRLQDGCAHQYTSTPVTTRNLGGSRTLTPESSSF